MQDLVWVARTEIRDELGLMREANAIRRMQVMLEHLTANCLVNEIDCRCNTSLRRTGAEML